MESTAKRKLSSFLKSKDFIILDGAMGTELPKFGLKLLQKPEFWNIEKPEYIWQIHEDYLAAGSDLIYSNTFGLSEKKLKNSVYSQDELIAAALQIGRKAIIKADHPALLAFDMGPLGELMYPNGTLTYADAYEQFVRQVILAEKYGADLILIESMSDLYELKAAIMASLDHTDLPVICSMAFETDGLSFGGTDVATYVNLATALGVSALGINCSHGPNALDHVIQDLLRYSRVPILLKPNAGMLNAETGQYSLSSEDFTKQMRHYAQQGIKLLGGCCGTNAQYIARLKSMSEELQYQRKYPPYRAAVSTASKLCYIDEGPLLVGESLNSSAPSVQRALEEADYGFLAKLAVEQEEAGADLLDLQIAGCHINEARAMEETVKALMAVCHTPLSLDSKNPLTLEAGLKVYNGRPLVNSLSLSEQDIEKILPLAKKYAALLILSPIRGDALPQNLEEYRDNLGELLALCLKAGYAKEELIADALVLNLQSQPGQVREVLERLRLIREVFGLKSCLGISNISFGLKARRYLNQMLLAESLGNGLDIAIANCRDPQIPHIILRHKALEGDHVAYKSLLELTSQAESLKSKQSRDDLASLLEKHIYAGLQEAAEKSCGQLMQEQSGLRIIEDILLPVLDELCRRYNEGEIFLPQLLQSAGAAQRALDLIRKTILQPEDAEQAEVIIMATVKGDVHDIGKNIAKTILQNYGYQVIDLGHDVPPETVAARVVQEDCKLLGLSALMTNTLAALEETIRLVKAQKPECKVMLGGAVLTEDYAYKIGADYYCHDANSDIKWAREVFKG